MESAGARRPGENRPCWHPATGESGAGALSQSRADSLQFSGGLTSTLGLPPQQVQLLVEARNIEPVPQWRMVHPWSINLLPLIVSSSAPSPDSCSRTEQPVVPPSVCLLRARLILRTNGFGVRPGHATCCVLTLRNVKIPDAQATSESRRYGAPSGGRGCLSGWELHLVTRSLRRVTRLSATSPTWPCSPFRRRSCRTAICPRCSMSWPAGSIKWCASIPSPWSCTRQRPTPCACTSWSPPNPRHTARDRSPC